jgi:thiol-disulfide isomerase/thioredoxin
MTDYDAEHLAALREHPPHLAKFACGHVQRFPLPPVVAWGEWCTACRDFVEVIDEVQA